MDREELRELAEKFPFYLDGFPAEILNWDEDFAKMDYKQTAYDTSFQPQPVQFSWACVERILKSSRSFIGRLGDKWRRVR